MRTIGNFLFNFVMFYFFMQIFLIGVCSAVAAAIYFVAWTAPTMDHFWDLGLPALRISVIGALAFTISWIFTDGRREWMPR